MAEFRPLPAIVESIVLDHPSAVEQQPIPPTSVVPLPLQTLSGWRLWLVITSISLGLLLTALETSIVATALVTISSELGHFELASWIVVAYMLTYTGFLIIFARLSDIFGRKSTLLISLVLFTTFSVGCGFAQSITTLISLRTLQGLAASGIYALSLSSLPSLTPVSHLGIATAGVSIATASASILGPVLGGFIAGEGGDDWRWVFWLNGPPGVVVIGLIMFIFPKDMRNEGEVEGDDRRWWGARNWQKVDIIGVLLSLLGSVGITFALESGGTVWPWNSGVIIGSLVAAFVAWALFIWWEVWLMKGEERAGSSSVLPVFPIRLMRGRVLAASVASAFLTGFPFIVTIITLPQRLQIVSELTPLASGIRMLPLLLSSAVGAGFTGTACKKKNIAAYLLVSASVIQVIGMGVLSTLPVSTDVPKWMYAMEAVLGFSFGMGLTALIIVSRLEVEEADSAVTTGAITQVRVLGGIIGLAICQAVIYSHISSSATIELSSPQIQTLLSSTTVLVGEQGDEIRRLYGEGWNLQMKVLMGFAGMGVLASAGTWKRHAMSFMDFEKFQRGGLEVVEMQDTLPRTTEQMPKATKDNV